MRKNQRGQAMMSTLLSCVTAGLVAYAAATAMRPSAGPSYGPSEQRADVMATPLPLTSAVTLTPATLAVMKAYGIEQLGVEPIGSSTASFVYVVNGKTLPETYSTIHAVEQMYRIDVSSGAPKVYLTERLRKTWEPDLVSFYLEKELQKFDEEQQKQARLRAQWSASSAPRT